MKAREREIVVNDTWSEVIGKLPDKKAGRLFKKILKYSQTGVEKSTDDKTVEAIFSAIRTDMDRASFREA